MYWVVWVRGMGAFRICGLKVVWCGRGRKSEGMDIGYFGVGIGYLGCGEWVWWA